MRLRDSLPSAAVLDPRYSVQLAPCTVCGATLDVSIPPFATVMIGGHEAVIDGERVYVPRREVQVSGVTIYRCPKCKTVETEAMRQAARRAFLKLVANAETAMHPCARPSCPTLVPPARRYCGRDCAALHQQEQRREKLAEHQVTPEQRREAKREALRRHRAKRRAERLAAPVAYTTVACECGCGKTFDRVRQRGERRRFLNDSHRRNAGHRRARQNATREVAA